VRDAMLRETEVLNARQVGEIVDAIRVKDIVAVASSPGRAGVLGNPSDMYGGSVISCSIPERAYCIMSRSPACLVALEQDPVEFRSRSEMELCGDNLDIFRAVCQYFELDPKELPYRFDLHTDIPVSAGLSGSTSLLVCVLACLLQARGERASAHEIAEMSRRIEGGIMHLVCGFQDAYMSAFGGLNYLDFRGKEKLLGAPDEPYATVEPLGRWTGELPFVLAHSGVKRVSGTVHRPIRERWLAGEPEVVRAYERVAQLARLGKMAMLSGDWDTVAALMNENHAIQRSLGGSGEVNERLIRVALENGAIAAKLAGAGHGGTIIALTFDPGRTAASLMDSSASRILYAEVVEGLKVEPWESSES